MSGGYDINRAIANAFGNYSWYGAERIPLGTGRTISDGVTLTPSTGTPPYTVVSAFGGIVWGANAGTTTGVEWDIGIPGEYAKDKAAEDDELRFLLIMKGGAATGGFVPTILYQRAGSALSASIPLTGYKKGLTLDALETASFAASTTFTLTATPTQPEAVMLQFTNAGLKPFDAARLTIGPSGAANTATTLFGMWMLPKRYAAIEQFRK